jgi:hypothetical protein
VLNIGFDVETRISPNKRCEETVLYTICGENNVAVYKE